MLTLRIAVFLLASALACSNASAQLIHSIVASKPQAVKSLQPNDSAALAISTPAKPLSEVTSQSAGQAGMVVTNAWPNPLHPASTLHLEVLTDKEGSVSAGIYDLDGTQKATLSLGELSVGSNELQVDVPELSSGEYIIRIQQGSNAPEIVRINYIK